MIRKRYQERHNQKEIPTPKTEVEKIKLILRKHIVTVVSRVSSYSFNSMIGVPRLIVIFEDKSLVQIKQPPVFLLIELAFTL